MEESRAEASSPLATIDEIQRRLLRPPSLQSQSSIPIVSSTRRYDFGKQVNSSLLPIHSKTNRTLDDYLDPVLLSTVRAKIGGKKRKSDGGELKRREYDKFKWPGDQLKMFEEVSSTQKRNIEEAIDLGNDADSIGDNGDSEGEVCCTPFGKFEKMALKKFKRGG